MNFIDSLENNYKKPNKWYKAEKVECEKYNTTYNKKDNQINVSKNNNSKYFMVAGIFLILIYSLRKK